VLRTGKKGARVGAAVASNAAHVHGLGTLKSDFVSLDWIAIRLVQGRQRLWQKELEWEQPRACYGGARCRSTWLQSGVAMKRASVWLCKEMLMGCSLLVITTHWWDQRRLALTAWCSDAVRSPHWSCKLCHHCERPRRVACQVVPICGDCQWGVRECSVQGWVNVCPRRPAAGLAYRRLQHQAVQMYVVESVLYAEWRVSSKGWCKCSRLDMAVRWLCRSALICIRAYRVLGTGAGVAVSGGGVSSSAARNPNPGLVSSNAPTSALVLDGHDKGAVE
jgi:hypothetical protein